MWRKLLTSYENRRKANQFFLLLPATAWLLIFFIAPLLIILVYSFLEKGIYGGVNWVFTLENYRDVFKGIYWGVFGRSLWLALLTTVACLIIGYPLAFFIATRPAPWRNILLILVIIPFWTNFLVRTYAWFVLFRKEGVINTILQSLHMIDQPLTLLFTPFAVIVGLIYGYLPFMVLPLFATIEKFNFSLVEAAHDLGANDWKTFIRIILPLTKRGIIAGCLLVFIPAVGAFITPDILGGAKTIMIGNIIQNQFLKARNWPLGSALSMMMMVIVLIPVFTYLQVSSDRQAD
jgi:spermidine/putrescine transport system permease protein